MVTDDGIKIIIKKKNEKFPFTMKILYDFSLFFNFIVLYKYNNK